MVQVVAEVLALTLAALRVLAGWNVDLAGFMGALIVAGAAWVAVKQYALLATTHSIATKELAIQAENLRSTPEEDWTMVAADAEEAISRNTQRG